MYPNLYYFIKGITGWEGTPHFFMVIQTFGFFLALTFLVAGTLTAVELKRKEKEGLLGPRKIKITLGELATPKELIMNALIGFVLGFKLFYAWQNWDNFLTHASDMILSGEGHVGAGVAGAILLAAYKFWEKWKDRLPEPKVEEVTLWPHEQVGDMVIIAAISGLVGAKIFALMETPAAFFADPVGTFFSGSGLAVYGGLIGAFTVMYFEAKRRQIDPIHLMDVVAPLLILGYGIGRLGCHFSGDGDWGIVNEMAKPGFLPQWLWALEYPHNVINESSVYGFFDPVNPLVSGDCFVEGCEGPYCHKLCKPVYPTSVYEFIMAVSIFSLLWVLRKRIKIAGFLFFMYMLLNGIERMLIETIRVNDRYEFLGMHPSQAQLIAGGLIIGGIAGMVYLWKKGDRLDVVKEEK